MNQKRVLGVFVLSVLMISMFAGFVSAQGAGEWVTNAIDTIAEVANPVLKYVLGPSLAGEDFFVKVLAFFLVTLIFYAMMDMIKITDKGWINFAVGLIIAIIGVRYLPEGFLESMTEPASALVALLVLGLPFIFAFYLIEKVKSTPARRAIWAAYGALILVLFFIKWADKGFSESYAWVDLIILVAIFIAFWFDGTFSKWRVSAARERAVSGISNVQVSRIMAEIRDLEGAFASAESEEDRKKIKTQISNKKKALKQIGI